MDRKVYPNSDKAYDDARLLSVISGETRHIQWSCKDNGWIILSSNECLNGNGDLCTLPPIK